MGYWNLRTLLWRALKWSDLGYVAYFFVVGLILTPMLTHWRLDSEAEEFARVAFPEMAVVARKDIEYTMFFGDPGGTCEFRFTGVSNPNYQAGRYSKGLNDDERDWRIKWLASNWPDLSAKQLRQYEYYNDGITFLNSFICTPEWDCEFFLFKGPDRAILHLWHI